MDRPLAEYEYMLKLARGMNIRVLKYHGLECEFLVNLPLSQGLDGERVGSDAMPTEDQLLYWSSGFEPPIQSESPSEV